MKKLFWIMCLLFSLVASAASLRESLRANQGTLSSSKTETKISNAPSSVAVESATIVDTTCVGEDQTSLSLSFLSDLILEKDGEIKLSHDPRSGTLSISASEMIGNCSDMIEWKLKKLNLGSDSKVTYAVEAKIKKGKDCDKEGLCKYKIAKVVKGEYQKHEEVMLRPNQNGFKDCLEKSGVFADGKLDTEAIYSTPLREKFDGVDQTGNIAFLSHGSQSRSDKAKYGEFLLMNKCDHYEVFNPKLTSIQSLADENSERLEAEASKVRTCGEYEKVASFIEKYESYASELESVRDNLIKEAAKKAAKNIAEGKHTEEDLKVIADFDKYIVRPQVKLARLLYEEADNSTGDAKKAKLESLKRVQNVLADLNKAPYFTSENIKKLISEGKFDDAENLNTMKLILQFNQKLGTREGNVLMTPGVATDKVAMARTKFVRDIDTEKEKYEARTGQVTGRAEMYAKLISRLRQATEVRIRSFYQEINNEQARLQFPNGYCVKYFVNKTKCQQEVDQRVAELISELNRLNKLDTERIAEFSAKAQEFAKLEAEGRRTVATQGGTPTDGPSVDDVVATTTAPTRAPDSAYNFNWQGQQQGNQQQTAYQQQNYQPQQGYQQQPAYQQQSNYQFQNQYQYQPQYQSNSFQPQFNAQANYNWQIGGQQQPYQQYQNNQYGNQGQNYQQQPVGQYNQNPYTFNWNPQQQQQSSYYNPQQSPGYWQNPSGAYNNNTNYSFYSRGY